MDVVKKMQEISASNSVSNAVDCTGTTKAIDQMIQDKGSSDKAATVAMLAPETQVSVNVPKISCVGSSMSGAVRAMVYLRK